MARPTDKPIRTVLVIGGGIVGVCCARELRQRGFDVTLVEKGDVGAGASGGNAGSSPTATCPSPSPAS